MVRLAFLALAAMALPARAAESYGDPNGAPLAFGRENLDVIRDAKTAKAYRVVPHSEDQAVRSKSNVERFAGYAVRYRRSAELEPELLQRLRERLLDPSTLSA